jgi:hypothetical protein
MAERPHVDPFFRAEFRDHVGQSLVCCCNFEGPDTDCNVGVALWNVAHRGDWEDRKAAFLKRGRSGSP